MLLRVLVCHMLLDFSPIVTSNSSCGTSLVMGASVSSVPFGQSCTKTTDFLAFLTMLMLPCRARCASLRPVSFLIYIDHKWKAVKGNAHLTWHPAGLLYEFWLCMGKKKVVHDIVCRFGELPLCPLSSCAQITIWKWSDPDFGGPTSTLCVSRQRSSPLISMLSGIDDVKMFSDFGFPPVPMSCFKVLVPRCLAAKELLATS